MESMRKTTVSALESVLEGAQKFTRENVTATAIAGLRRLQAIRARREVRKLRGAFKGRCLEDMRRDRE
jgi:hypothetical protein